MAKALKQHQEEAILHVLPTTTIVIPPLDFQTLKVRVVGTAPLMQARFSEKAKYEMESKMEAGSTAGKGKQRSKRDFQRDFENAQHRSEEGWNGIPASAFRNACISACRIVGFQMTRAKLSIFLEADGVDAIDGTPLVRLVADKPEMSKLPVRNSGAGGTDIRARPMWRKWAIDLRVKYDAGQFTSVDIANLLVRAGAQVGVGEGRPDSKFSAGIGFGTFRLEGGVQ